MLALAPVEPAGPRRVYTGEQVAAMLRRSWGWWRKVRHVWTRERDFPAELNDPGEPVIYDAEAVDRWMIRRSQRRPAPVLPPEPSAASPADRRAASDARSRILALRGRNTSAMPTPKGAAHA
jgi:hypothetical protein